MRRTIELLNSVFKNSSFKNLFYLTFSTILIKFLGFGRESIVAYFIGNTTDFAQFNVYRSIVDFISAFVIGVPIFEGILVPKYAKVYSKNNSISFYPIKDFTDKLSYWLFLIVLVILLLVSYFSNFQLDLQNYFVIFLLATFINFSLYNNIYFSLNKVIGNFKNYAIYSFLSTLISLLILLSLIQNFAILSIILSFLGGVLLSNWILKSRLNFNKNTSNMIESLDLSSFNWLKFILINHVSFLGFTAKFIIIHGSATQINYFHYSYIVIFSIFSILTSNIASISLFNNSTSAKINLKNNLVIVAIFMFIICTLVYFFGLNFIKLLFEHGKFNNIDSIGTKAVLNLFLIPFFFFSISQILLQEILIEIEKGTIKDNILKFIAIILPINFILFFTYGYFFKNVIELTTIYLLSSSIILTLLFIYLLVQTKKLNSLC